MIRPVVIVTTGPVDRPLLEELGAIVLETADAALLARHLQHAFAADWPDPCQAVERERAEPPAEQPDYSDSPEPLLCRRCRADCVVTAGTPPHAARATCPACRAWRWVARAELRQAAIDPATLPPANAPQLEPSLFSRDLLGDEVAR